MGSMLTSVFKGAGSFHFRQNIPELGGSLAPSGGSIGNESEITHSFNYTSQRGERAPLDGRGGNVGKKWEG